MKRWRLGWLTVVVLAGVVGCSSGGGTGPGVIERGTLTGDLGGEAAGATVRLEGTSRTAVCDAGGRFTMADVPAGEYTVSVTGADGTGAAVVVRVADGQTTTVPDLTLTAAGQIAGLVTARDRAGNLVPVAQARVVARPAPLLWAYAGGAEPGVLADAEQAGARAARQGSGDAPQPPPRETTTDADGAFRFTGVTPEVYVIDVTAAGYEAGSTATWVEAGRTASADVELVAIDPDNATVTGQVTTTLSGQTVPLAYVRVDLWPAADLPVPGDGLNERFGSPGAGYGNDDPWYIPPLERVYSTFTDDQGRYALTNVRPGEYRLGLARFGYTTWQQDLTLGVRQAATVNAHLETNLTRVSGTIYGRTADGGQAPLAGAWVTAFGYVIQPAEGVPVNRGGFGGPSNAGAPAEGGGGGGSEPGCCPPPGVAVTDEHGRWELEVEAGNVVVNAWADGYEYGWLETQVGLGGASGLDLVLEPWAGRPDEPIALRRR